MSLALSHTRFFRLLIEIRFHFEAKRCFDVYNYCASWFFLFDLNYDTHPIIRRVTHAIFQSSRLPRVIVRIRLNRFFALLKPFVLIRWMIRNEVQNNLQSLLMCRLQQVLQVRQGAKYRINFDEVWNIVAEIDHGAWINRGYPERIDVRLDQMIQLARDTCGQRRIRNRLRNTFLLR